MEQVISQGNAAAGGPSNIERAAIFLREAETGHDMSLAWAITCGVGAGTGILAEILTDKTFVNNHRYQALSGQISNLESSRSTTEQAAKTLQNDHVNTTPANARIKAYTGKIDHLKTELPGGYQPHIEGLADFGGFAIAAALFGSITYKSIRRLARNGKAKIPSTSREAGSISI